MHGRGSYEGIVCWRIFLEYHLRNFLPRHLALSRFNGLRPAALLAPACEQIQWLLAAYVLDPFFTRGIAWVEFLVKVGWRFESFLSSTYTLLSWLWQRNRFYRIVSSWFWIFFRDCIAILFRHAHVESAMKFMQHLNCIALQRKIVFCENLHWDVFANGLSDGQSRKIFDILIARNLLIRNYFMCFILMDSFELGSNRNPK